MKLPAFFVIVNLFLTTSFFESKPTDREITGQKEEEFEKFFRNFCQNSRFQLERIRFPLKIVVVDEEVRNEKLIQQSEWRHTNLLKLKKEHSKNTLETINKEHKAKDVVFTNNETDEVVHHLFSIIDNQWFLVSIIDESK